MKVEFCCATGCNYGQFIIYAENKQERAILRQFVNADMEKWEFHLHGYGGVLPYDGPSSFNFGWIKKPQKTNSSPKMSRADRIEMAIDNLRELFSSLELIDPIEVK